MDNQNNYMVIQPPTEERDSSDQIDQVFGSKINSQVRKPSNFKLEPTNNQLHLSDPKMDAFRGLERPSPFRQQQQYEAASTSPLESVFRGNVNVEAYVPNYHQSTNPSFGVQDLRYSDWNQTQVKGFRKSPDVPQYRQYGNQYSEPVHSSSGFGYQARTSEPLPYNVGNQRYSSAPGYMAPQYAASSYAPPSSYAPAPHTIPERHNRYNNVPLRSPITDPYSSYGGSFSEFSSSSYSRDEFNPFSPGSRSSLPPTPTAGSSQTGKSPSSSKGRNSIPPDGYIYQVQFKRAHKNYILAPSAPRDILPGDFVKVEADRGEDMGIVLAKIPESQFEEVIPTAGYRGRGFSSGQGERKYLFRLATAEERTALTQKVLEEEKALETIREKAVERGYPMVVLDAEYQFDRHKLTFYFEADRRIDFRELVSELFSQYKTRIWMQQVDTSSLPLHDPGTELAKATGFLPERDEPVSSSRSSFSLGETTKDPSLSGSTESDSHGYLLHDEFTPASCSSNRLYPDLYNNPIAPFSLPTNDPWSTSRF